MKEIIRNILREHTKEITELKKLTTPEFKERAKKVWGDKYNYDKVDYKGVKDKVTITCPIHGDFPQTPKDHFAGKEGCDECEKEKRSIINRDTLDEFIKKAKKIHGNKYVYTKVDYRGSDVDVEIICPKHGTFTQTPNSHIGHKAGCPDCGYEKSSETQRGTKDEFVNKAKKIHGNKYDYTKVDYQGYNVPVEIICNKHNFSWSVTPKSHNTQKTGCPLCSESRGEKLVAEILGKLGVSYERGRTFPDCKGICKLLPFDFYLPKINTCIEYDGRQHYEPVFGEEKLKRTQASDQAKNVYCEEKGINLIRIPYTMNFKDIPSYIIKEIGL
jgi:hypothetical protein